MKKLNVCLIVFAILMISVTFFTGCGTITGPDPPPPPDTTPKNISVEVKYVRIEPWYLESSEVVSLNWKYSNTQGAAVMPKISENTHAVGNIPIKTETRITMGAEDWRKRGKVRKRFFICFKGKEIELIFNGSEYGDVVFVLHNNDTIEIISPL
jgi:hypothetical protein